MEIPYKIYFFSLISIHVIYGFVFLGVFSSVPQYVYLWNMLVQIGLCLFLMFRYHPFKNKHEFSQYDSKLIFGSSMLLLINIVSLPVLYTYVYDRLASPIQSVLPSDIQMPLM